MCTILVSNFGYGDVTIGVGNKSSVGNCHHRPEIITQRKDIQGTPPRMSFFLMISDKIHAIFSIILFQISILRIVDRLQPLVGAVFSRNFDCEV